MWVRQDRIFYIDPRNPDRGVRVVHRDGEVTLHSSLKNIEVYRPVSNATLEDKVHGAIAEVIPKVLSEALKRWQQGNKGEGLSYLIAARFDLVDLMNVHRTSVVVSADEPPEGEEVTYEEVTLADWLIEPAHHYMVNRNGPPPDKYVTWPAGQHFDAVIPAVGILANQLFYLASNYGSPGDLQVEVKIGDKPIKDHFTDMVTMLDMLIELMRSQDEPELLIVTLPDDRKRHCARCDRWMPLPNRRARYCTDACRQSAYRARSG
jgi:hypothetical protein